MPYSPMELAEAFIRTGELDDALDALNQQISAEPADDRARRMRIAVLMQLGEERHLRPALIDCGQLAAASAEDHVRRSIILERLNDLDGALQAMRDALAATPDSERLIERNLYLLVRTGSIEQARRLAETQPNTWRWLQWRGDLAVHAGDSTAATQHYTEAVQQLKEHFDLTINPYARAIYARLLLARADTYRRLRQVELAENDYVEAAAIVPDDPVIPFNRGLLAALRGDMQAAVALCNDALTGASDTLRAHMLSGLQEPPYDELAKRLGIT